MKYYKRKKQKSAKNLSIKELESLLLNIDNKTAKLKERRLQLIRFYGFLIQYKKKFTDKTKPLIKIRDSIIEDKNSYTFSFLWGYGGLKKDMKIEIEKINEKIMELSRVWKEWAGLDKFKEFLDCKRPTQVEFLIRDVDNEQKYLNQRRLYYTGILTEKYRVEEEKEERLRKLKEKERKAKEKAKSEIDRIKGLASRELNTVRERANQVKKGIIKTEECPYCGVVMNNIHIDHIYPVAKGGLSTNRNMVAVCSSCNMKKSSLTLAQFIQRYRMDRNFIESNLDLLGKDY